MFRTDAGPANEIPETLGTYCQRTSDCSLVRAKTAPNVQRECPPTSNETEVSFYDEIRSVRPVGGVGLARALGAVGVVHRVQYQEVVSSDLAGQARPGRIRDAWVHLQIEAAGHEPRQEEVEKGV